MQLLTVTCMLLVLSNKGKGMQSSSEHRLVARCVSYYVTTLLTTAKETKKSQDLIICAPGGSDEENVVCREFKLDF